MFCYKYKLLETLQPFFMDDINFKTRNPEKVRKPLDAKRDVSLKRKGRA